MLYRELIARGVSEYLVAPFGVLDFIAALSSLYHHDLGADRSAASSRWSGAKGGVGASCLAHNLAWSIARDLDSADRRRRSRSRLRHGRPRFQPGSAAGHRRGGVRARSPRRQSGRPPAVEMQRQAEPSSPRPRRSTASMICRRPPSTACSTFCARRRPASCSTCRIMWTAWTRRMLSAPTRSIIVATPDLANLRNAKSLLDMLRAARPNDPAPRIVLNSVGVPKRPEIARRRFRQGDRGRAVRRSFPSSRSCSAPPPTTAR